MILQGKEDPYETIKGSNKGLEPFKDMGAMAILRRRGEVLKKQSNTFS